MHPHIAASLRRALEVEMLPVRCPDHGPGLSEQAARSSRLLGGRCVHVEGNESRAPGPAADIRVGVRGPCLLDALDIRGGI